MEKTFDLELKRPAKSQGGDRYETPVEGEAKPWAIYIPQSVSRNGGGDPAKKLTIVITTGNSVHDS